ncbi:MAG: methionyl-tRNA formyltransferase [Verrucomicrobiales bacterium]|nr:methionyl-tRNA formyltransferase [Verrucomicrobiales bacterium]
MRVLYIGTGEIGLPSLKWLLESGDHEVVAVVTQPDKPVGRRQVLTPPGPKVMAQQAGLPVLQPQRLRQAVEEIRDLKADVAVVIAYGQLLSQAVLDAPRLGCLNVHASLLPRHRGAAPIQAAIRDGDAETGVTIMYMDAGLDTGDILLEECTTIGAEETGGELHDRLALLAPPALERALALLDQGSAPRLPQDSARATHTGKLERDDGRMDWGLSAQKLARWVRAYDPWPGTFAELPDGRVLKIYRAQVAAAPNSAAPGTVLQASGDEGLLVACGEGALRLLTVQLPGGRRMEAVDFLRGHSLAVGSVLR